MNENQIKFIYGYDLGAVQKRAETYSRYLLDETVIYLAIVCFLLSVLVSFLGTWLAFAIMLLFCLGINRFVIQKCRKKIRDNIEKRYPFSFELPSFFPLITETKSQPANDALTKGVDSDTEPS